MGSGRSSRSPSRCWVLPFSCSPPQSRCWSQRRSTAARGRGGGASTRRWITAPERYLARVRRSGADVGREVLAGEGGAGGDEVGGRALEDDPAAVVAGAGTEVDEPVGVRHDRLVVLDDDDRLAGVDDPVEQAEQLLDVGEVQARGRLVEDVDVAPLRHLGGELEP